MAWTRLAGQPEETQPGRLLEAEPTGPAPGLDVRAILIASEVGSHSPAGGGGAVPLYQPLGRTLGFLGTQFESIHVVETALDCKSEVLGEAQL